MLGDTFRAGVAPGSPITHSEVKLLILHALSAVEEPVGFALLHEAMREHDLINYFALVEATDQLTEAGQLLAEVDENGGQTYLATQEGRALAAELATSLPLAQRQKAAASLQTALKRKRRRSEVHIMETKQDGGYLLELSIPDLGGDLLSLKLFAPTWEERGRIMRRFLNDPIYIYQRVLSLLTGDASILGDMDAGETFLTF
jgi:hypothetical protein